MEQASDNTKIHQTMTSSLIEMALMLVGSMVAGLLVVWLMVQPMLAEASEFGMVK